MMGILIKQPLFSPCAHAEAGAPIWVASTPVGEFRYGTDNQGVSYWQDPNVDMDIGTDVGSLEQARECAESAYFKAVRSHPVFLLLKCEASQ